MLDFANNHIDEVNNLLQRFSVDKRYKYFNVGGSMDLVFEPDKNTWSRVTFVSLNEEGVVSGLIKLSFDAPYRQCLLSISNSVGNIWFMKDVEEVIKRLFIDYQTPRIHFVCLIGNPAELFYDRVIGKVGGSIIGIGKKAGSAMDGEICDVKYYEILLEDYLRIKEKKEM